MGMFDNLKMASEMMKNMSPEQIEKLMKQAEESKKMLEDTVRKTVDEEIKKRNLVSREEVARMLADR
jgi:hypothetical protein